MPEHDGQILLAVEVVRLAEGPVRVKHVWADGTAGVARPEPFTGHPAPLTFNRGVARAQPDRLVDAGQQVEHEGVFSVEVIVTRWPWTPLNVAAVAAALAASREIPGVRHELVGVPIEETGRRRTAGCESEQQRATQTDE